MKVSKLTMAAVVRKKQDDKNLKILREIVLVGGNRQCFDCEQKGPTYCNMTIGSFVCAKCAGSLRGLTPPHRVKSISMATFTAEELEFIKERGNDNCGKTWLGLWDPKRALKQEQREFMIDKYEHKRYYLEPASPLQSLSVHKDTHNKDIKYISDSTKTTPAFGRTRNNTSLTSPNSSASNFPMLFTHDNSAITKIQPPNIKINNGQINGTNRANILPRNLNNNNTSASDSDFVADFSTANIFNAATYNNSSSQLINSDNSPSPAQNGVISNENANFADFEHNPIFNAGFPTSWAFTNNSNISNNNKLASNINFNTTDRYAALKDLDEQLREDKSVFQTQATQSVQEHHPNPFKMQNGNLHPIINPFQMLGETKGNYSGAMDNERFAGSNNSQLHQRNPFQIPQIPNTKSNNPFL